MAVPPGTVEYTEFLKSKEYFRLLPLLYPKTRESKWISKFRETEEIFLKKAVKSKKAHKRQTRLWT